MKKPRVIASVLMLIALCTVLMGCYAKVVVLQEAPRDTAPAAAPAEEAKAPSAVAKAPVSEEKAPAATQPENKESSSSVKTGLAISASTTSSKDATAEKAGVGQSDISIAAVMVDGSGRIVDCVIDAVQSKVSFGADGSLLSDAGADVLSKNELGDRYGMRKASKIGAEWNEQAASFAEYVIGLTADEVEGLKVSAASERNGVDLASSVTLYYGGFADIVAAAARNAEEKGAKAGDRLVLSTVGSIAKSKAAADGKNGNAQTDVTVAAVTLDGDRITSIVIDAVQPKVAFDQSGRIQGELSARVQTKKELKEGYGMSRVSSIKADWYQQAAAYEAYVTGKTLSEAMGISVSDAGKPSGADLASSVTMSIGDFTGILGKI